jgi:hypothetical protein
MSALARPAPPLLHEPSPSIAPSPHGRSLPLSVASIAIDQSTRNVGATVPTRAGCNRQIAISGKEATHVHVIDFANSYMTFFTKPHQGENIARILIDAAATIADERTGAETTYCLIAPCRSEHMYLDGQLFQMPNYEFCGVFTADQVMLVRTHWISDRDNREVAPAAERFAKVDLAINRFPGATSLPDRDAIVAATLANRPLVARTELSDEESGQRVLLEYPIKTMNVVKTPPQFQVDTGPIIVPDFTSSASQPIERFAIAHVVYHTFDKAEFVLRRPHQVGERDGQPVMVTDYTEIVTFPARNDIFAGA